MSVCPLDAHLAGGRVRSKDMGGIHLTIHIIPHFDSLSATGGSCMHPFGLRRTYSAASSGSMNSVKFKVRPRRLSSHKLRCTSTLSVVLRRSSPRMYNSSWPSGVLLVVPACSRISASSSPHTGHAPRIPFLRRERNQSDGCVFRKEAMQRQGIKAAYHWLGGRRGSGIDVALIYRSFRNLD